MERDDLRRSVVLEIVARSIADRSTFLPRAAGGMHVLGVSQSWLYKSIKGPAWRHVCQTASGRVDGEREHGHGVDARKGLQGRKPKHSKGLNLQDKRASNST